MTAKPTHLFPPLLLYLELIIEDRALQELHRAGIAEVNGCLPQRRPSFWSRRRTSASWASLPPRAAFIDGYDLVPIRPTDILAFRFHLPAEDFPAFLRSLGFPEFRIVDFDAPCAKGETISF